MTEKRYGMSNETGAFIDKQLNKEYTDDEIIDLLNEQHEQIERLKRNFKALDEVKCELADENEQLKQNIRELQNDKLLTELQMKCDKKQEHIVVLENKIMRMREAIHKLEWLASHRNADLIRENEQLKEEIKDLNDVLARYEEKELENDC